MFGLFGFIGYLPNTELFADAGLEMENGYIRTDEDMQTNLPGVYAAGDLRVKSLRQVVTAAADGAIAPAGGALCVGAGIARHMTKKYRRTCLYTGTII